MCFFMHGVEIYKSTTLREKWTRLRHSPDHPLSQRALSRRAAGSYPVFFDRRRAELSRAEPQRIMRERRRQTAGAARSSLHLLGPAGATLGRGGQRWLKVLHCREPPRCMRGVTLCPGSLALRERPRTKRDAMLVPWTQHRRAVLQCSADRIITLPERGR